MAQFRPQFRVYDNDHKDLRGQRKAFSVSYPTYRELKKDLPNIFNRYTDEWGDKITELHVSRSRRGEWGEYFEIWKRSGDKFIIVNSGWM